MMKTMNSDTLRALTPMLLAVIGGAIGLAAVLAPELKPDQRSSGIGLAGTAIAGAAGLAQTSKSEPNITAQGNARIVQDNQTQPSGTP
jgi:hypothetical protein